MWVIAKKNILWGVKILLLFPMYSKLSKFMVTKGYWIKATVLYVCKSMYIIKLFHFSFLYKNLVKLITIIIRIMISISIYLFLFLLIVHLFYYNMFRILMFYIFIICLWIGSEILSSINISLFSLISFSCVYNFL